MSISKRKNKQTNQLVSEYTTKYCTALKSMNYSYIHNVNKPQKHNMKTTGPR